MKKEIETLLNALRETPRLLKELINEIDPELYKEKIIKGKWTIHEHAIHIEIGDIYGFQKRLNDFKQEQKQYLNHYLLLILMLIFLLN